MMYYMKNITSHHHHLDIPLPTCMYRMKNLNEPPPADESDINICAQVMKFLKMSNKNMTELEKRQDLLLEKLDILYDRIKTISSYCNNSIPNSHEKKNINETVVLCSIPDEIVLVTSPDNLPWYLIFILKGKQLPVNITWHIHSSVPNEKLPKINAFVKRLQNNTDKHFGTAIRLIFKCVSADAELKLSSLAVPIVGNVNILRYLSLIYPSVIPYDEENYYIDSLLDLCHVLERATEKNREAIIKKLFSQHKDWIYGSEFCIVDIACYNAVKQLQNRGNIPKLWYDKCDKLCL